MILISWEKIGVPFGSYCSFVDRSWAEGVLEIASLPLGGSGKVTPLCGDFTGYVVAHL